MHVLDVNLTINKAGSKGITGMKIFNATPVPPTTNTLEPTNVLIKCMQLF